MGRDRDEYSGRFTREYNLVDFVKAVKKLAPASTLEIAEEIGCSRDLAYHRLKELDENGAVNGKVVGGTYHWFPGETDSYEDQSHS